MTDPSDAAASAQTAHGRRNVLRIRKDFGRGDSLKEGPRKTIGLRKEGARKTEN
jgi:hypothetical protein